MLSAQVDLTNVLQDILFDALSDADVDIPFDYLSPSVEDILALKEKADKALMLFDIIPRTKAALIGARAVVPKKKTSISIISDILKMRKFVELFPHLRDEPEKTAS